MAKYLVTHACGHALSYDLVGKLALRNYRIGRMEQEACQECRNAVRNQQSAQQANSAGLPELTGTEKQIAWATTIRQVFMGQVARVIVNLETSPDARLADLAKSHDGRLDSYMVIADALSESVEEDSPQGKMAQALQAALLLVQTRLDSSWWIDNRGLSLGGAEQAVSEIQSRKEAELAKILANEQLHAFKAEIRAEIAAVLPQYKDWELRVGTWSGQKRVYFGKGFGHNLAVLHVTGNSQFPPGTLQTGMKDEAARDKLKAILARVAKSYNQITICDIQP